MINAQQAKRAQTDLICSDNILNITMLFLPDLIPRNVQQLAVEADEELFLIQQEAQLKFEV